MRRRLHRQKHVRGRLSGHATLDLSGPEGPRHPSSNYCTNFIPPLEDDLFTSPLGFGPHSASAPFLLARSCGAGEDARFLPPSRVFFSSFESPSFSPTGPSGSTSPRKSPRLDFSARRRHVGLCSFVLTFVFPGTTFFLCPLGFFYACRSYRIRQSY